MSAAEEIQNLQQQLNWHWRNSMRTVRFFMFDSRAGFVVVILFFRLTDIYAWLFVFGVLFFFNFLEKRGLTFPAAMRTFRAWIVGRDRPGWPGAQKKKFTDFG